MSRVLLVDDEQNMLRVLTTVLQTVGHHEVSSTTDSRAAVEMAKAQPFDLVITDLRMAPLDGIEVLRLMRELRPEMPVVMITAFSSVETAMKAHELGAFDYVPKPFRVDELLEVVDRAIQYKGKSDACVEMESRPEERVGAVVARSEAMRQVCDLVKRIAQAETPVLLAGPAGTGRRSVAEIVHMHSRRQSKPFAAVRCEVLSESAAMEGLFGAAGGFAAAAGGTLFLDEVERLPAGAQAKLAAALKEKKFRRPGSTEDVPVDVRVVASTARDLEELARDGVFRDDLRRQITGVVVKVPPLRDRRDDVLPILREVLDVEAKAMGMTGVKVDAETCTLLKRYAWPGNGDEMREAVRAALPAAKGNVLRRDAFPPKIIAAASAVKGEAAGADDGVRGRSLKKFIRGKRRDIVRRVVEESGGDRKAAARTLNISLVDLNRELAE